MAPNHLGITDSGRLGMPSRHFHGRQILLVALIALAIIGGGTILGLSKSVWQTPTLPAPQYPGGYPEGKIPSIAATPVPQPTPTATPVKKILAAASIMLFLGRGNGPNYEVGYEFSGWTTYPFPIFVSRSLPDVQGQETFATILDPKISEIGGKWESVFTDPKYPDHLVRVKLTRIASTPWERADGGHYDYEASVSISWDNGKSWEADSLPWPTAYIQMQKQAEQNTPKQ